MSQGDHAMSRNGRCAGIAIVGALAIEMIVTPAFAMDWQVNPRIVVNGIYNDNYRLDTVPADKISVEGAAVDASAQFHFEEPEFRMDLTPRLQSTFFPGNTQEQANNQFLDLNLQKRWQRVRFSLTGFYWREIVLSNFLPTTDITNGLGKTGVNPDIGPVTERNREEFALLNPSATFDLTPIRRLIVDSQIIDLGYADQIAGVRENFKSYTSGLALAMDISPRSTVSVRASAAEFRPDVGSNANTYGVQTQWSLRQTELLQFYARVGEDHAEFGQVTGGGSTSANSFSGGIGTSRKFELTDLFVDLTRAVTPNSGGSVVAQDQLRLRLEHKFSARMAGFVAFRAIKDSALGNNSTFTNDRYITGSLGFEWRLYRQFSIAGQYIYTTEKYTTSLSSGNSNSVIVSLIYQPHRLAQDAPILND
jgi:hypothetical protein